MPSLKSVSVDIVTPSGLLPSLHQETSHTHSLCESYILSRTDCPFWVSITPDRDPFTAKIRDTPNKEHPHLIDHIICNTNCAVIDLTQDDQELENYLDSSTKQEAEKKEEWHLLAEVFLDNRSAPETSAIVYLPWNGKVKERVLRGRISTTENGQAIEKPWLFRDVGLESFLETLSVTGDDADGDFAVTNTMDSYGRDYSEDMLVQSMQKLGSNGMGKGDRPGEIGQIKIVLQKIIITGFCIDIDYMPNLVGKNEPEQVGLPVSDASHTAGFGSPNDIHFSATRKSYRPYSKDSEPYATFIFYYRGEKQMRKLGFLNASEASHKKLDKLVPFLTPLPISGNCGPLRPREISKARFRPSGPVTSTSDEGSGTEAAFGSDRDLEGPQSEAFRNDNGQPLARESSSSERPRGSSGSSDSETVVIPTITDAKRLCSLADPVYGSDFGLVIPAAAKFAISPSKSSAPLEGQPRDLQSDETTDVSESDTGYEGDTETPKITKEKRKKSSQEAEKMKELTEKLRLVQLKRSHADETDDGDDRTTKGEKEGMVQRHGQIKRIRWHKDTAGSVEAEEEYMSEAKEN